MDIQVMELPAVRLACLRYKGPFGPAIGEFWKEVFTPWQKAFGLHPRTTYGLAQDDPDSTPPDQCRYDACVEVKDDYQIAEPAREAKLPLGRYAVTRFKGNASQISAAWRDFFQQAQAQGMQNEGPCFERYEPDYLMDPDSGVFEADLCIALK
jgi:AraC family transcriptional regulator